MDAARLDGLAGYSFIGIRMLDDIAKYLRETAQKCVALARNGPDAKTSHELEAISISLMEKAFEIEQWRDH